MVAVMVLAVLVTSLLAAVLIPGALADRTEPRPDGDLRMEEIVISAENVSGERLDFATDVRLTHRDGVSENVTIELRAVRLDSGLVEASETTEVGTVDDDGELSATGMLQVERGGDYRIEALVFQNGVRETTGSKTVQGTGALTPGYPDSPVEFHQFTRYDLPVIDYRIAQSDGESATLDVRTYLTNSGETRADDLSLVVKSRQVESGIVASEQEVDVESIGPSQTARPGSELTVPTDYNYYLEATLWKDGVIVDTARTGATLDPTETVQANETERDVELEIGEFESRDRRADDTGEESFDDGADTGGDTDGTDDGGAGFGVGIAVVALVAGMLYARVRTGGNQ
jgi:PGF-CTERM protein